MSTKIKKGATFKVLIEFEQEEWDAIYPWDSVEADVSQRLGTTERKYDTIITETPASRSISITTQTADWEVGPAKIDIRVVRGSEIIMIPYDSTIEFSVVESVTLGDTP